MIPIFFTGKEGLPMSQPISQDRNGFQVREGRFPLPEESWKLDPKTKRAVTICNLFVNHHYGISDIVRVLDENRRNVVLALLTNGIIRDRRVRQTKSPDGIEKRKTITSPNVLLRTPKKQY
jgi:hypothetical protein